MASGSSSNSSSPTASSSPAAADRCSICMYDLSPTYGRTVVTLRCSHTFHLDCIGSAFNFKRAMECPNCRIVEAGQWHFPERRWRIPDPDMDNMREDQMVPEYQWCPNHGWGWAVHTNALGQAEENHERVVIADMAGPPQTMQQQNSVVGPTAAANRIPDVNTARGTANADPLQQASSSNGAGGQVTGSSIPDRISEYSRYEIGESSSSRDSRVHNDRSPLLGSSANGAALQVNGGAGSSNGSRPVLELDFVPRGALEALGTRRLRTTHYVATPVEGSPELFTIRRSYQFTRRNQRQDAAALGDALRNITVANPVEPAAPEENGRVPDEEAAATGGNGVDANQEPSN